MPRIPTQPAADIHWRPVRAADLAECLEIQPACIGDAIVGRERALGIWRELLASPAFNACVIESEQPGRTGRILACGMGLFVAADFVDEEIAHPRPGLNARIIAGIDSGDSVVLDIDAIAAGNAGAGLDYVNMYGSWRDGELGTEELAEVQTLLGTSFVDALAGYRFNRILKEAIGEPTIELARATGTYRLVAEFPEAESALAVASRESALSAPYSLATRLYRYSRPVLRLRPGEQALLGAALAGGTDAELSTALGLSLETVKKRWISIFERFDEFRPGFLTSEVAGSTRRGRQKRHRVVAYIREHLEELRPFDWRTSGAR